MFTSQRHWFWNCVLIVAGLTGCASTGEQNWFNSLTAGSFDDKTEQMAGHMRRPQDASLSGYGISDKARDIESNFGVR